jgi:hypothetical protein
MRLRVSDPALVPELLEFLHSRLDVVTEQITANDVSLSLLGSYASDAMRMELHLRVRAWEAAQRTKGVEVEFVDSFPTRPTSPQ